MTKLIGTAPNQVPTNADLGSLAYSDHDNVNLTPSDLKLKALSKTKDATAVDVFVYDTSKDTDGGAWRHRTQHTSWYNEGASSTRGSRKEFPSVAVIVAEEHSITIYDGDDPSLPMWMAFPANKGALGGVTSAGLDLTSVAMLNGVLVGGYGNGLSYVNLLSEVLERGASVKTSNTGVMPFNVAERDQNPAGLGGTLNLQIVNSAVNDVAMTVLPNAPTDPATGLPVPTIAVATNGGVSVIKDDGTVVDITGSAGNAWEGVSFASSGRLFAYHRSVKDLVALEIPSADYVYHSGSNHFQYYEQSHPPVFNTNSYSSISDILPTAAGDYIALSRREATSVGEGVSLLYEDPTTQANGMVAYTTSTYTTGWMNGDIKLAALADTTAETFGDAASGATVSDPNGDGVYDGEHVTNGTFDTDTTGWTDSSTGTGSISWNASGYLDLTSVDASNRGIASQSFTTVIGKTYVASAELITSPASNLFRVGTSVGNGAHVSTTLMQGVNTFTFTATATTTFITAYGGVSAGTGSIDNVSVRLADPDRSVNGNGLEVHGSITKAPVETGADLVGYSGFSASNYLEQPYNSDLDFGTGDFCVMGWLKTNEVGNDYIVDCRNAAATVGFLVLVDANGVLYFSAENASAGNVTGTVDVTSDTWRHFAAVRSNSGTNYSIYVDGQLDTTEVDTAVDVDSTDRFLHVGAKINGALKFAGSLALIRISGTAPTADQIKKIYEDEKFLFQENAAATLYGSSDAVTALAYDDKTQLLHVGTSEGRSEFQGLRRINNTTNAVTTAISVSDNLVVEQ